MFTLFVVVIWLVSGAFTYAITLGDFWWRYHTLQSKREFRHLRLISIGFSLFGPVTLPLTYILSYGVEHGLMWQFRTPRFIYKRGW